MKKKKLKHCQNEQIKEESKSNCEVSYDKAREMGAIGIRSQIHEAPVSVYQG